MIIYGERETVPRIKEVDNKMFKLIRRIHPFTKKRKMEIIVQIFCNGKLDSKKIKIIMNEMRKLKYSLRKKGVEADVHTEIYEVCKDEDPRIKRSNQ